MRVTHDGGSIAGAHRAAFAQPMSASPRLIDDAGASLGGYWALRPDPTLDPRRRIGRVIGPPPDRSVPGTPFTAIRPLLADFAARQIDDAGLFRFADPNDPTVGATQPTALNFAKLDASGFWTGFADDGPTRSNTFFRTVPLVVNDLGGYRFQLGVTRKDNKPADFFLRSTTLSATTFSLNYDQRQPDPAPPASLEVLFRFYPDGTQIGVLQEGEVALFQQCNYQGRAAVFALDAPNLSERTSPVITLDKTAASVRLGNNTGAILHSGLLYTGTEQVVEQDIRCLTGTPIGSGNTSSLQIRSLSSLLISSRQCEKCQLVGVDLSGIDLSGTDAESRVDLTGANLTMAKSSKVVGREGGGNYVFYGVREFGMCAVMNGLALHGGFIPYGGTFLVFSDYARNAIRLAALMGAQVVYVFTHDSIGLGEDGPTHQPIEHAASLRLMPNLDVWRPADTVETAVAWRAAVERKNGPTALLLTRQNVPFCKRSEGSGVERGGYVLADAAAARATIIATGSEVAIAVEAQKLLAGEGIPARVVSMPSTSVFDRQDAGYRNAVLGTLPKVAVEAGVGDYWRKYVGLEGAVVGIDRYGESAPAADLFKHFGFTGAKVAEAVRSIVK
jgi:transketolase C-terminal domain/subunit